MSRINKSEAISFPIGITFFGFKLNLRLKSFWIFAFLIIFSFLIVSVYQFNVYTAEIYFIHNAEKKIAELSQENKVLEINLAKANSLWNVGNYVQGFEKAGELEYIRVLESTALAR